MARKLKPQEQSDKPLAAKTRVAREKDYEISDTRDFDAKFAEHCKVKTMPELIALLEKDKSVQLEAHCLFVENGTGIARMAHLNREKFIEAFKGNKKRTFRESVDSFAVDGVAQGGAYVGQPDFTPLMGGPFNKQLYQYDYLKMHAQAFYAYNHDPILHSAVEIIRDFVLGRGWRVDCNDPLRQAIWDSFAEVNDLDSMMDQICEELSIYGEIMQWWLPGNETKIAYNVMSGQAPPRGLLPRVRLIDPSVINEIVTYPEDIKRVLYYNWLAPTQSQMYSGVDGGKPVSTTKFINQQIPANQVDHYKVNCRSNEKRGRSDLFSVLGYAKRLRDSVNYSIIGLQKSTAWSIDTTIEGSKEDVESYMDAQSQLGTIPPPGSEFVHTNKITRQYLSNEAAGRGNNSSAFDWCFSMICAGLGIPQQYFGTHLSGGSTRATAMVATEPVNKKFEARRKLIEKILQNMAKRLFSSFGLPTEIDVTFPELASTDRSTKLKDLTLAESQGWISKERAAEIAAKELGITKFDFKAEKEKIAADSSAGGRSLYVSPLSSPGAEQKHDEPPPAVDNEDDEETSRSPIDSNAKNDLRKSRGF